MHIVIILVLLFFYFYSQSFRRLIHSALLSMLLAVVIGYLATELINENVGFLVGFITFFIALSKIFKALALLTTVVTKGGINGSTKYMEKRSEGKKHESSLVDGSVEGLMTVLQECKTEDSKNKLKVLNVSPRSNTVTMDVDSLNTTSKVFFEALDNSDTKALSAIKSNLSESVFQNLINAEDEMEDRPLHIAVRKDSPDTLSWLLSNGANKQLKNYWGLTALEVSMKLERDKCAGLLSNSI